MSIGKQSFRAQSNRYDLIRAKENHIATRNGANRFYTDKVKVDIERLALTGFNRADKYQIAIAIENELARLLSEKGTPSLLEKDHDISRLSLVPMVLTQNSKAPQIGIEVARQLYVGLGL
jgi:hypothetical protein